MSVRYFSVRRHSVRSIDLPTTVSPERIKWWLSGIIVRAPAIIGLIGVGQTERSSTQGFCVLAHFGT